MPKPDSHICSSTSSVALVFLFLITIISCCLIPSFQTIVFSICSVKDFSFNSLICFLVGLNIIASSTCQLVAMSFNLYSTHFIKGWLSLVISFFSMLIFAVSRILIGLRSPTPPYSCAVMSMSHMIIAHLSVLPYRNSLILFLIFVFICLLMLFTLALWVINTNSSEFATITCP